jgi:hypothetical protein
LDLAKHRVLLATLVLLAIALPSVWAAGYLGVSTLSFPFPLPQPAQQGIVGNITIGNVQPLCRNTGIISAQGPSLNAHSRTGTETIITVNWRLVASCTLKGTFHAQLNPGTYDLTITRCPSYPGAQAACFFLPNPPVTVTALPTRFTPVNIQITTGIY